MVDVVVKHNTFYDNNKGASPYNGEIVFFPNAKNGVVSNNSLQGSSTYALDLDPSCTGFSGNKNGVYGFQSVERGSVLTNTVQGDPQLDANHNTLNSSFIGAGEYLGGRDFYGLEYSSTPNIGAVEQRPSGTITARSVANRSTETRITRLKAALRS